MRTHKLAERGSALILAMVVTTIGAGLAATALTISAFQSKTTSRESTRERALTVAESGLDVVIYRMNNWTTGTPISTFTGTIGGDTFTVTVTPAFSGVAGTYTLRASATRDHEKRGVQTTVSPTITSQFPYGLMAKGQITMSGDSVNDSYRSSAGTYLSQRTNYDPVRDEWYASSSGNIGTNGNISMSGSVVNYGNANPGVSGNISMSGGPYVSGSTSNVTSPIAFTNPTYTPPIGSMGDFQPSSNTTLATGTYRFNKMTLSGSTALTFAGDVTVYIDGDVSISGQAFLNIPVGSKVKFIQNSGSFTLSGGGLVNASLNPANFSLTSSSSASITFSGNTSFYGTVYAPNAQFSASGNTDYFGAFAASTMNISGGANFHRDEDAGLQAVPGSYRIRSWIEYIP